MTALPRQSPRQVALNVCFQVVVHGQSLSDQLEKQLVKLESNRDRSFCSELCYGFCRYYYLLQINLKKLLKKPLKSRDRDVQIIILLGLYQIRFMRVEDHAAVNESVKLLQKRKKAWAKGLVNAVLRTFIRNQSVQDDEAVSLLTSEEQRQMYPEWIVRKISRDWKDASDRVLEAGNQRAPMTLRVNSSAISTQDYLKQLDASSIKALAHPVIEDAVLLQTPLAVEQLPGFSTGLVSVQDAAAQLAARLLDCQPGMKVLDACAAPGGKTLHILQSAENLQLTALDKDAERLSKVEENLQRGGVSARLICVDAVQTDDWFDGQQFDRILLDAPCTASGIIRRHPDIRLLRQLSDVSDLVEQQKQLLTALWPLLRPGGLLLYSTCSIFKEENEHQIRHFLSDQDLCKERPSNDVEWGVESSVGRQILPGYHEMDGFYYACLVKTG